MKMVGTSCISVCSSPRVWSSRACSRHINLPLHASNLWSCMSQSLYMPKPSATDLKFSPHQKVSSVHTLPQVSTCRGDHGTRTVEELQERTRLALRKCSHDPAAAMQLIDSIQRLGIEYYFEEEISAQLERFSEWNGAGEGEDLFVSALRFRLLRHNGWPATTETFKNFLSKDGKLKESVSKDTLGVLSLHEASYLGSEDEDMLLQAMESTRTQLTKSIQFMSPQSSRSVAKALEYPRHLRMARLEARNYIDEYSREWNHSLPLLELAKVEFNKVQLIHQRELAEIHRWWKELGLVEKLGFGRDKPLECLLWSVGIFPEPYYSNCRIELSKTVAILNVIDDIFDTYGTLSDLILFTNAIQRWDLGAMEEIPEYMKICYMALYNTTNEISYRVLKEHGWNIVPHLKRTWIDLFDAYLAEAKWVNCGYVPTSEEYLANGVISGGTYMALVHAFFLMGQGVSEETVAMMKPYPSLFSCSGKILRLWDDLGTAREEQERGDVASIIECYMREKEISCEEEARKHIRQLIRSSWVELNGELKAPSLPSSITKASLNLARTTQLVYQQGDDINASSVSDHVQTLFFNPLTMEE